MPAVNVTPLMRLVCLLALAGMPMLVGCTAAVSPTDQTLIREADQLHARLKPAVVEDQDPRLKRYFEQLASRITTAAQELNRQGVIKSQSEGSNEWMFSKQIDCHLIDSELPYMYTSGGHHLYIYHGLFELCRNEDELASLFCHEYAHVYARHVQKELRREPSATGDEGLLLPFVSLKFTPAHEKTADTIAYQIYLKAGWDPTRFTDVYKRLAQTPLDGLDPQAVQQLTQVPGDPPSEARNWGQPPVADDARFAQLQSETRAVVGAMQQNEKARLLLAALPNCLGPADSPTQAAARERLFPPPPGPAENKWNKGLQGAR